MTPSGTLNTREQRFIEALTVTPTVRDAAAMAEIAERTAWRYLQKPIVKAAIAKRQDAMLSQVTAGIVADMTEARDTLKKIMNDKTSADRTRVSAARAILDCGLRLFEMLTLADRVSALEDAQEAGKQ